MIKGVKKKQQKVVFVQGTIYEKVFFCKKNLTQGSVLSDALNTYARVYPVGEAPLLLPVVSGYTCFFSSIADVYLWYAEVFYQEFFSFSLVFWTYILHITIHENIYFCKKTTYFSR